MQIFRNKSLTVKPGFCLLLAFHLLLLPLKWVVAWFTAAVFHELCHLLMLLLCGVSIHSVCIGFSGAVIETDTMCAKQEVISSLAGPVGGMLLLFLLRIAPAVAVCALIQSIYNLLPVYPLDGGRALMCLLSCRFGQVRAVKVSCIISNIFLGTGIFLSLAAVFLLDLGLIPLTCAIVLAQKIKCRKFPCKQIEQIVQ